MIDKLSTLYNESYPWQKEAITAHIDNSENGTIEACTGSGKTRLGLMTALKYIRLYPNSRSVAIIVPTTYLLGKWYKDLKDFNPDIIINKIGDNNNDSNPNADVDIYTFYGAVHKYKSNDIIVIIDEIHGTGSPDNRKIFDNIKSDKILGLTATFNRSDEEHEYVAKFCPVIYQYKVKNGIEDGVVNKYILKNVEVNLTTEELKKVNETSHKISQLNDYMGSKNPLGFALSVSKIRNHPMRLYAVQYLKMVGKRKTLVQNAHNKPFVATNLILNNPKDVFIVFNQSIAPLYEVKKMLSIYGIDCSIYHSKMSKSEKFINLKRFTDGLVRVLLTAKALDEGFDVRGANSAIIMSGSSSQRQHIQRIGRVIRKDERDNSTIYQLYTDTVEKTWMLKGQEQ